MPRKIRELRRDLLRAGFSEKPGKGSHRIMEYGPISWSLSGQLGDDADRFQEKAVKRLLEDVKKLKKGEA